MLGLRRVNQISQVGQPQQFVRTIIQVKRRASKGQNLVFGKKINYRELEKVEPIKPKQYEINEGQTSHRERLNNLDTYQPKTDHYYYVTEFSKLGALYKPTGEAEDWNTFNEVKDKNGRKYYTGSNLKLSNEFKVELGKSSFSGSTPFPRISGNSAPLVAIPAVSATSYVRGMLNKRDKLNALDFDTLNSIEQFIRTQVANELVGCYSIHSTTPGVVQSAGLDFLSLYESMKDKKYISDYFKKVSKVFYLMSVAPKPQLAIVDGLAAGAGLGFAANSGFRVGTEASIVTVPDCSIGFFPNAGTIRYLNRIQDGIGLYMVLTGRRLRGAELVETGMVDFFILSSNIHQLDDNLSTSTPKSHKRLFENIVLSTTDVQGYLDGKKTHLATHREAIKRCFDNKTTVEEVLQALENETEHEEWAERCIRNIRRSSPVSIKLAMRLYNETPTNGTGKDYYERDYNISMALAREDSDLWEGIQSLLFDNREPNWGYKQVEDVPDSVIDEIINYKPNEPKEQLKLVDLKTTFTLFENILLRYTNDNQIFLSDEEHNLFSNYENPVYGENFDQIHEIWDKGARSKPFYADRTYLEFLNEVEEGDF